MTEEQAPKEKPERTTFSKEEVVLLIRELVDRPKGVVPDLVYKLIPSIRF